VQKLVIPILLIALSGCENPLKFDPQTTAILKITGLEDEAQKEQIKEQSQELVAEKSSWHSSQISEHGETTMIKLSPVKDVQGYADRIKFGKVTAIDGNIIHVTVGNK